MNGLPGYAGEVVSPLLALAIESTRQALMNPDAQVLPSRLSFDAAAAVALKQWTGLALPALESHDRLPRLAADCRMAALEFEALAGLDFHAAGDSAQLRCFGSDSEGPITRTELVTLTRPGIDVLVLQADEVVARQRKRLMPKSDSVAERDRLSEIQAQIQPPLAFWSAVLPLQPELMPRTMELILLTLSLCRWVQQRFKHALAVPRPHRVNLAVFPAILTPSHGSLPSGHATEAFAVAEVLSALLCHPFPERKIDGLPAVLLTLAARIADNREIAGVHYQVDTLAGRLLGTVLACHLVARCGQGKPQTGTFMVKSPIVVPDPLGLGLRREADSSCTVADAKSSINKSDALGWLWSEARKEWGG
jgi:hypothetical protein